MQEYEELNISMLSTLDEVVEVLELCKELGEKVYCNFNGHILYSDKTTLDSAYLVVCGKTKSEYDRISQKYIDEYEKKQEEAKLREKHYSEKVAKAHQENEEITMEKVIEGLKFIAENRYMEQEELLDNLLKMGITFTLEDIEKYMKKHQIEPESIYKGIIKGDIVAGASIICNMRDNEFSRSYGDDRFLSIDDETSIYAFIRNVTGDQDYTKENIESKKLKKRK